MRELIPIIDGRIRRALSGVRGATHGILTRLRITRGRLYADLSGLPGENLNNARVYQQYGFASYPLEGAHGAVVMGLGNSRNPIVVAIDDHRHRVELQPGQVALYNNAGVLVLLDQADIYVNAIGELNLNGAVVQLNGGDAPVNRQGDATAITTETDPLFAAWVTAVSTLVAALDPSGVFATNYADYLSGNVTATGSTLQGNPTVLA